MMDKKYHGFIKSLWQRSCAPRKFTIPLTLNHLLGWRQQQGRLCCLHSPGLQPRPRDHAGQPTLLPQQGSWQGAAGKPWSTGMERKNDYTLCAFTYTNYSTLSCTSWKVPRTTKLRTTSRSSQTWRRRWRIIWMQRRTAALPVKSRSTWGGFLTLSHQ